MRPFSFSLSTLLAILVSLPATSQQISAPSSFRLVTPNGPGSITVTTEGGWSIERFVLYDKATRAVLLMTNDKLGLNASYILSNDETFDYNRESCKSDVLGPLVQGLLKNATISNKQNATRSLPSGQTLDIGSYLIVKNEGIAFNQENVFGFIAQNHTCAEIHLSSTSFKAGDEALFEPLLMHFSFDPSYIATPADYRLMGSLLPPGMASAYPTSSAPASPATTQIDKSQSLTFALPNHPGYLHMDAPNFAITELSAKPNGKELGIRANDNQLSHAEALGFFFMPNPPQPTAIACRDWMIKSEKADGARNRKILKTYEDKSDSGIPIALIDYEQSNAPPSSRYVRRLFVAQEDLCLDLEITAANVIMVSTTDNLIKTLTFDPTRAPDFLAKFRYASILYDHHAYAAAAPIFESAMLLASTTDNPTQWRRIATDQASMAYGMSGDLAKSRAVNENAIKQDPDYPLYYYNLACADAESGDAPAAQHHLQQAFDHRANTLQGESMPDPTMDDSFLKLKSNTAFWAFVQSLPKK